MYIYKNDSVLFTLPDDHPAKRFLNAFVECRQDCVGREIGLPGSSLPAIDQEWFSETDQRKWRFSEFAYSFLSFDVVLDGWLTNASELTDSERAILEKLPYLRRLLQECNTAAVHSGNSAVVSCVGRVLEVLHLWEECSRVRAEDLEGPQQMEAGKTV